MKKQILLSAIACMSIVTGSIAGNIELPKNSKKEIPSSALCYVKMKDGSIRTYLTLSLEKGLFVTPHLLANGKEKISAKDVLEYRTTDILAIAPALLPSLHKSNVSIQALPGFAVKVLSGPLNVYARKLYNGTVAVDEFFVQLEEGDIKPYSAQLMKSLLRDHPLAIQAFEKSKELDQLFLRLKYTNEVLQNTALAIAP
jgi:hypothetical protein